MNEYQIAQINVGRMQGVDITDPVMKEFFDNLDKVYTLAESSKGFIWRLKDDGKDINMYEDVQIIINISVWQNIETLEEFIYKTFHAELLKRRREWFQNFGKASTALWWILKGEFPSVKEAVGKLEYLERNGPSELVFDLKNKYLPRQA